MITNQWNVVYTFVLQTKPEALAAMGFPGAGDLAQMYKFYMHESCVRDVALTQQLNPDIMNVDQWLAANKANMEERLDKL